MFLYPSSVYSGMDATTAALVHELKKDVRITQTLAACAFAAFFWDYLGCIHAEYHLVWVRY